MPEQEGLSDGEEYCHVCGQCIPAEKFTAHVGAYSAALVDIRWPGGKEAAIRDVRRVMLGVLSSDCAA